MRHFPILGYADFHARPLPGIRFYRELTRDDTHTFLDDHRTFARLLHLLLIDTPRERESPPIIFHRQIPLLLRGAQSYQRMPRTAMLPHVDQALLHDAEQFTTDSLRHV